MRTTVDIPDPLYRALKSKAATEGSTVKQLILQGVVKTLRLQPVGEPPAAPWVLPNIETSQPATLKLGVDGVYEYIPFP